MTIQDARAQSPPAITEYPIGLSVELGAIITGPDGALWSGGSPTNPQYLVPAIEFVRVALDGAVTTIPVPETINCMVAGPDGAIWYASSILGRVTTAGVVTEFPIPTPGAIATSITVGPDGALWFTENQGKIGRATTDGTITEFSLPAGEIAGDITTGPDGALWFGANNITPSTPYGIQRITTAGMVTDVATVPSWGPMAVGPDGAVWVAQYFAIARITTAGVVTEFALPGKLPGQIVAGPDGALWFTDTFDGTIGRITTAGVFTEYPIPGATSSLAPSGITVGPDAALWFTGWFGSNLGRAAVASNAPLQVETPSALPSATTNVAYSWPLAASGGTPPYTWSITSGSLPAGLSLATNGAISGTPTATGSYNFSATVMDSTSATAKAALGIAVVDFICNPVVTSTTGFNNLSQAGGPVAFTVSVNPGCAWTIGNLPFWIRPFGSQPGGGMGNGGVALTVEPNYTASYRNWAITVAGVSETIQEGAGLISAFGYMPHLVAEGGWRTTFTMVNKQTLAGATTLTFADDSGNPLALPLTLPQQPSAAPVTEASIVQPIPGNGLSVVEASGPANLPYLEGAAAMTSTSAVDGFAIFHFDPSGQEAVVPIQVLIEGNGPVALAFDNTNGVQTGVALQMINAAGGNDVGVTLVDDTGAMIGTGTESITLPQSGHTSFVLSTQFPVTANIRGTAIFTAPAILGGGPFSVNVIYSEISVLGIRYTPPGTLTTLPALPTGATIGSGTMAHIASGNGWQTTFVLMNPGGDTSPAVLNFYDDNGNPLSLPLTFLDTGVTTTASSVTQAIPGALWIQTSGDVGTPLLTGSAQLVSSNPPAVHNFGALAIFRYNPNGQEAVVPLETRNAESYLLAFDNTNDTATGVAISVASSQAVSIPVIIRDGTGAQLGTATIPLAGNGHTSFMLATQFPSTAGILGTLEFDTPAGAQISVLGIRSPPALTFTTLPALAK